MELKINWECFVYGFCICVENEKLFLKKYKWGKKLLKWGKKLVTQCQSTVISIY